MFITHKLLTFTENDKFDGSNWITFKNLIIMAAKVCKAMGYLDGLIRDPLQSYNPLTHLTLY